MASLSSSRVKADWTTMAEVAIYPGSRMKEQTITIESNQCSLHPSLAHHHPSHHHPSHHTSPSQHTITHQSPITSTPSHTITSIQLTCSSYLHQQFQIWGLVPVCTSCYHCHQPLPYKIMLPWSPALPLPMLPWSSAPSPTIITMVTSSSPYPTHTYLHVHHIPLLVE